jgi:hypothetical protein
MLVFSAVIKEKNRNFPSGFIGQNLSDKRSYVHKKNTGKKVTLRSFCCVQAKD